jgi:hypothetical protein
MMNQNLASVIFDVLKDVQFLRKFIQAQMIGRGVWDNVPTEQKQRMLDMRYVTVEENRVRLTREGLEVIGYREATA